MRTLIDNLPDGIVLKDRESRFIFANRVIAELMGAADPSVLPGKTDRDFYPQEVADALLAEERVVIETRKSLVNKEESKSLLGGMRRVLTTKVPVFDAAGEVTGLLGITRDITERHNAEEDLQRSDRRYRDLLEQAPDGIFLLDEKGNFLIANMTICNMLGYSEEELLQRDILDTYPQELREVGKARLEEIISEGAVRFQRQMMRKDGSSFPVEMSARRLADGRLQGIAHDITERKRTESKLALERRLLEVLLDNIPDYIYFKDTQSRFIRTSRAHARIFGLHDAKEAIGKTDMDFFSEEHALKALEDEQRIIRTGEPILNVEEKETWPDRPQTWALTTKMPLRDQEGSIIGTFGISRDITETKRAQESILSLARFPDESPHPVMRVKSDGAVIYKNKASEAMTSSWAGVVDRKAPEEFLRTLTLSWESGEQRELELLEGQKSYVVTFVPFAAEGYVNIYGRDVTEEKKLSERLNQAQKMEAIGQLTGGVAHDFNNILQAITGYCEVLRPGLAEKDQKFLAEITKATQRAAALTAQLLAFSRKQILRPQVVDTKDLIAFIQKMLERVIGEDIELRTSIDPDTGNFLADPGQMEQVLLNLAVNARDAMPSGGTFSIETSNRTFDEAYVRDHPGAKAGLFVCIAVSDTGIGMDQETLSHIYEPFFTTKELGKGTGLGLATVFGIVKQSEGYINCYSEPGKGTTFTIYLPVVRAEADRPKVVASGVLAPRGTETILLVDDDTSVRSITRIALEGAGYFVIEASRGKEALSEISTRHIAVALLVTDVVMPQMSGRELAQKLEEACPGVKVLYVSGYTANVISHHGILETGVEYLQKPFSTIELLTKVREILDRR